MPGRIAVAAMSLGTGFQGTMYGLIKKLVRPGDELVECSMVLEKTPQHLRARLLGLLEGKQRPTALIGLCIQPDPDTIAAYRRAGAPIVVVDEEVAGTSTVASDNHAGGVLAARHLLAVGRRTMAVVCGHKREEGDYNSLQRVEGFRKGLAEAGLTLLPHQVLGVSNYSRKDGVDTMVKLLAEQRGLDAVFCAAGDVCAEGMLSAASVRGVTVPDQLAIMGYDDHPISATSTPPLTTIRQPLDRMAFAAYQLATADAAAILEHPRKLLFAPDLVARASTQRAPAAAPARR